MLACVFRLIPWLLLAALAAAPAARAEDSWNPFRDREKAEAGRKPVASPERAPLLPPMRPTSEDAPGLGADKSGPASGKPDPDRPAPQPAASQTLPGTRPPPEGNRGVVRTELPPLTGDQEPAASAPRPAGVALEPVTLPAASPRAPSPTVRPPTGATSEGGFWAGIDAANVERQLAKLELPVRSPSLSAIARQILTTPQTPQGAIVGDFAALRLDRLLRSGALDDLKAVSGEASATDESALAMLVRARVALALGDVATACATRTRLTERRAELTPGARAEALIVSGYCAATDGNRAGAGLSAELAREEGAQSAFALATLDNFALDQRPGPALPKSMTLVDYRYAALAGAVDAVQASEVGDVGVQIAIARDGTVGPAARVVAAERAVRRWVIGAQELADAYRGLGSSSGAGGPDPQVQAAIQRAQQFRAAEAERTPSKRARAIRALLDDARRAGLYYQMLQVVAPLVAGVEIAPEIGWFAETAIEVAIADGKLGEARRLAESADRLDSSAGGDGLRHWLALIDVAEARASARQGEVLTSVEALATRGRMSGEVLHRLATVLDALDFNVPIPLWDAANRAPPPQKGFLPETGVLAEMLAASKKRNVGYTLVLVLRALGPDGPEAAHIIVLGDTIRALRRLGREDDARRIAVEALFALWPRAIR